MSRWKDVVNRMDDMISRQDAIDTVEKHYRAYDNDLLELIAFELKRLPSAQPRPRGKWIDEGFYADGHGAHAFRCSKCGGHIINYDADPFCRWCGADMREEEQDE